MSTEEEHPIDEPDTAAILTRRRAFLLGTLAGLSLAEACVNPFAQEQGANSVPTPTPTPPNAVATPQQSAFGNAIRHRMNEATSNLVPLGGAPPSSPIVPDAAVPLGRPRTPAMEAEPIACLSVIEHKSK